MKYNDIEFYIYRETIKAKSKDFIENILVGLFVAATSPLILYYYCLPRFLSDKALFKAYQEYKECNGYSGDSLGALLNDMKNDSCYAYAENNMHRIERYFLLL